MTEYLGSPSSRTVLCRCSNPSKLVKVKLSPSTIDNISIEIASIMKNEINKNPYFLRPTITEFKNEMIQVELSGYAAKAREDSIQNKLHDKTSYFAFVHSQIIEFIEYFWSI